MARGWESKSVEAQIEAKPELISTERKGPTSQEIQESIEKRNLELARAKVARELGQSQNPRYSEMLSRALSELDQKIAAFE